MKANKLPKIIPLYALRVSVNPTGISTSLNKVPVIFTGKNYIPQMLTEDLISKGYTFGGGIIGRVATNELMEVKPLSIRDTTQQLFYAIYFLEGGLDAAKDKMVKFINAKLSEMRTNVEAMSHVWQTRKQRPKREDVLPELLSKTVQLSEPLEKLGTKR